MMTSAASLGLNILQDMNEPVFEMKFESLPPASKVGYRSVLLTREMPVPIPRCEAGFASSILV